MDDKSNEIHEASRVSNKQEVDESGEVQAATLQNTDAKKVNPKEVGQDDLGHDKAPRQRVQGAGAGAMSERRQRMELKRKRERRAGVLRTVIIALVALVAGIGIGFAVRMFVPAFSGASGIAPVVAPSNPSAPLLGRVSVSEAELDTPLGTYAYKGEVTQVSVREAIEESMSLDAARNADGNYDVPSVDSVLAVARNRLLLKDAETRGISASDEDARAYAKDEWGTEDLSLIAANYSMTKDQVAKLMKESATLRKLRNEAVAVDAPAAPEAPAAPADGKNDDPRPEYATYIMGLIGGEWDGAANTWATEDGPYHEKLKDFTISNDAATYSAAQAAYEVARDQQAAAERQIASKWTAYVNKILSEVTVSLGTLVI